jgi:hypothetical protein
MPVNNHGYPQRSDLTDREVAELRRQVGRFTQALWEHNGSKRLH